MIVVGERSYFGIKGKVCLGGIPEQRAVSHQKSFRGAGERGPQKTGENARMEGMKQECILTVLNVTTVWP